MPDDAPAVYRERGVASWYGPGFDGRRTANGERYDMNGISAAHKTLPFGTEVVVRNLDNGRSLRVRINDRGPFVHGRVIDLSKGAAKKLDLIGSGVANVELLVADWPEHLVPESNTPKRRTVQVASFREVDRAKDLARRLRREAAPDDRVVVQRHRKWHRVRIADIPTERLASVLEILRALGFDPLVIQR